MVKLCAFSDERFIGVGILSSESVIYVCNVKRPVIFLRKTKKRVQETQTVRTARDGDKDLVAALPEMEAVREVFDIFEESGHWMGL